MVAIELDIAQQERLDRLANSLGSDSGELAKQILVDYLDFQALAPDKEDAWAEASIQLAPELMSDETWDDPNHGSR